MTRVLVAIADRRQTIQVQNDAFRKLLNVLACKFEIHFGMYFLERGRKGSTGDNAWALGLVLATLENQRPHIRHGICDP